MASVALELEKIPLVRPWLPDLDELTPLIERAWASGTITTGPITREFEAEVERATGARHAVMVDHGNTALMLAERALALRGEVVVPAFSWTATAGSLVWNGAEPVFADIVPGRLTLDPSAAEAAITPRTTAIMPVNVFGVPADYDAFEALGAKYGLRIVYDSAQGLGASYRGRGVGSFGAAECFSLSPTKVVTAVEGGLVTTNDAEVAAAIRSMRDSGKSSDGSDIERLGLSGRPSELHAAVALLSFRRRDQLIAERMDRMQWYRDALAGLPGVRVQEMNPAATSTGNYFVIFIDAAAAPAPRDEVYAHLKERGIQTKKYFHPAIHLQGAYAHLRARYEGRLPVTEKASAEGLALPLFNAMTQSHIARIADAIRQSFGLPDGG